ncbi:MAG: GNAT family N-acetyltransferase [Tannerella sp.]|jgi:GNAT superfamily N-acetyltransferase|nr:GNAT family N-acetyltransferase [Tannerella sp.]
MTGFDFEGELKRLNLDTEIKPFESEDAELNDFLLNDAKQYSAQRLAVTYVIENETDTIAYFCLSNDTVQRFMADKAGWKKIRKRIPNAKLRSSYPAVKIGRLAVSKKYAGSGFGRLMIQIVREMFVTDTQQTGCRFVTVDAYRNAADFYIHNRFDFLTGDDENEPTRLMYFDLNNIPN